MANLYGVANPVNYPVYAAATGGVDIACPAGTETNIFSWAGVTAISQGVFYACAFPAIFYTLGATIPTLVGFNMRVNNGADTGTITTGTNQWVANGTYAMTEPLVWPASGTTYAPPGSTLQISCNPTGQAITVRYTGSWCVLFLFRAPDQ